MSEIKCTVEPASEETKKKSGEEIAAENSRNVELLLEALKKGKRSDHAKSD